jgi:hypothetical protein
MKKRIKLNHLHPEGIPFAAHENFLIDLITKGEHQAEKGLILYSSERALELEEKYGYYR